MGRYDLTDVQWERLKPLLPPEKPPTGRPNHDHRRILNGILWIDRTGAPWNDLPSDYGPVGTVSSRFYRWRQAGIWQRVLEALQALARIIRERSVLGDCSLCRSTFHFKLGKRPVSVARGEGRFGVEGTGRGVWARCPVDQVTNRASRDETTVRMSSTGNTKTRAI